MSSSEKTSCCKDLLQLVDSDSQNEWKNISSSSLNRWLQSTSSELANSFMEAVPNARELGAVRSNQVTRLQSYFEQLAKNEVRCCLKIEENKDETIIYVSILDSIYKIKVKMQQNETKFFVSRIQSAQSDNGCRKDATTSSAGARGKCENLDTGQSCDPNIKSEDMAMSHMLERGISLNTKPADTKSKREVKHKALETTEKALGTQVKNYRDEMLDEHGRRLDVQEAKGKDMQDQLTLMKAKHDNLEAENTAQQTTEKALRTELKDCIERLDEQGKRLDIQEAKGTDTQDQLTEMKAKHDKLEAENTDLKEENTRLKGECGRLKERMLEMERQQLLQKDSMDYRLVGGARHQPLDDGSEEDGLVDEQ